MNNENKTKDFSEMQMHQLRIEVKYGTKGRRAPQVGVCGWEPAHAFSFCHFFCAPKEMAKKKLT
jgi:hypothetical protein